MAGAAPYSVSVGYAYNLYATPGAFPTPWRGDGNVIFEGCQACTHMDASAVEVANTTGAAELINSVVVNFGPSCTYDIWPHDVTLPAKHELVITGNTNSGDRGCTPAEGQMDGSDIGPNGGSWDRNCHESGVVPSITVTEAGVATTYPDTGQVLNTGGIDVAECDVFASGEAEQWTPIGRTACGPATVVAAGPSHPLVPGNRSTLTARLQDGCGLAMPGAPVQMVVTSGPDAGTSGHALTDASGQVSFSLRGRVAGVDQVSLSVATAVGKLQAAPVAVVWERARLQLSASAGWPGTDVSYQGHGYRAGEQVHLLANSAGGSALATAVADPKGSIAGSFQLPAPAAGLGAIRAVVAIGDSTGTQGWAPLSSPCTDDWVNTSGGDWSTATDWSTGSVPGAADTACLIAPGTYTVSITAGGRLAGVVIGAPGGSPTGQQTLAVDAVSGTTELDVGAGVVNSDGVLATTSTGSGYASELSGGSLDNAGTLQTSPGSAGPSQLQVNVLNQPTGIIDIGSPTQVGSGHTISNDGTFTVESSGAFTVASGAGFDQEGGTLTDSGTFAVDGGTLRQTGGSDLGNPIVLQGSLLALGGGAGSYLLECTDTLGGGISAAQTVTVDADSCGPATTTLKGSVTNDGVITVQSDVAGEAAQLTQTNASLTNEADGTVALGAGAGFIVSNSAIDNQGIWSVGDGGTLALDPASSFGQGPAATLGVTLDADVSSPVVPVTGGSLDAAGTLAITTVGTPTSGSQFAIFSGGATVTGSFSTVTSGAFSYSISYGSGSVIAQSG